MQEVPTIGKLLKETAKLNNPKSPRVWGHSVPVTTTEPQLPFTVRTVSGSSVGLARGRRQASHSKRNKLTGKQARKMGNRYHRAWKYGR